MKMRLKIFNDFFFLFLKGEDNVDYFLGLTPAGIIVLRNKTKVGNYFWPRISKLTYKNKYFMIRVKNKTVSKLALNSKLYCTKNVFTNM